MKHSIRSQQRSPEIIPVRIFNDIMTKMNTNLNRCPWVGQNETMIRYHDEEWGVPVHDDMKLFEFIVLDSFQAGLSWAIILNKREGFREAFAHFQPEKVAAFTEEKINELILNPAIIRNKLKIRSTVTNAQAFLDIQKEYGNFDKFIWQFTDGETIRNKWETEAEIPTHSPESDAMSTELKKHGFKFVGTTICYAFMQAAGMINDHLVDCFRYTEVKRYKYKDKR